MTLKLRTLAVVTLAAALSGCGGSSSPPTTPTPAPGRWTISGTITDVAAQTPVAAARVEVVEGVNLGRAATADAQGRYQIATLEPGSFTVRAWADEFEPQTRAVTLAANQVLDFAIRRVGRTLAGTTVDALTDRAVAGVTVRVDGVGSATTAADGSFQLEASDPEVMRSVIISSPLTVERLTRLRVPGPVARLSLIPTSLDLRAFDEMFRADGGLHRWTAAPPVVLEMRVLQFTNVSDTQYTALAASMTDGDASTLIADLSWALPQLTGNAFGGFSSERRQMAAPTENVTVSRPGSIVVARYEGLTAATGFWGYTRWGWNGAGEIQSGILMLDRGFDSSGSAFRRSLRAHELGHALGYRHVTVRESVMNATARIEPNAFDRDGARIAFVRPPLNRSPDNDPDFFSGNLRYAAPLTWAGSH